MKKILLLGDSIRMGYDNYVKESMADVAEVYFPEENCAFTTNILRNLHGWTDNLKLYEADAVHFNVGHWDTLRIYGDDCLTKPEVYRDNLERIIKRINLLFPDAKIIFATSTPCIESGYIADFEVRCDKDIRKYNEIACEVMEKHGIIVNDLYKLLEDKPESYHSDQSHYYTPEATVLMGDMVSAVLCDALDIDKSKLVKPDMSHFELRQAKGDKEMYIKRGDIYVSVLGI